MYIHKEKKRKILLCIHHSMWILVYTTQGNREHNILIYESNDVNKNKMEKYLLFCLNKKIVLVTDNL